MKGMCHRNGNLASELDDPMIGDVLALVSTLRSLLYTLRLQALPIISFQLLLSILHSATTTTH